MSPSPAAPLASLGGVGSPTCLGCKWITCVPPSARPLKREEEMRWTQEGGEDGRVEQAMEMLEKCAQLTGRSRESAVGVVLWTLADAVRRWGWRWRWQNTAHVNPSNYSGKPSSTSPPRPSFRTLATLPPSIPHRHHLSLTPFPYVDANEENVIYCVCVCVRARPSSLWCPCSA